MKNALLVLFCIILFISSCKKHKLGPDPNIPALPEYSEEGANRGGMMINGSAWLISNGQGIFNYSMHVMSYPKADSLVICFYGSYLDQLNFERPHGIYVVFKNIKINNAEELIALNGKNFTLDGKNCYGGFCNWYASDRSGTATGNISFKKVARYTKLVYADGPPENPDRYFYIIAGQLEMKVKSDKDYDIKSGRFDIRVLDKTNIIFY